jgi:serine/threonine protein kinase
MSDTIGHYRIVRQIGEGGMGRVLEARDERLDRSVAIKILREAGAGSQDRFVREARAAAALSHPNICQIFEIGHHEGAPFLAMELLEGQSLADRLGSGPMPLADAAAVALTVLGVLDALHRRGLLHRDLKPSNIFLTAHGVKLLDFGLARTIATSLDETGLTLPGVVLGTPRYMAPEQARGLPVDARTDLFAIGAVLFEMLSGRPAFDGPTPIDILHAVLHAHPPALVGSAAIAEVDRVVRRALEKAPERRYGSAPEMATALRASLTHADTASATAPVRAARRLIVLPFRMLRPDPETDFLAFSLPDAITVSLSGLESIVIRSSFAAARYAQQMPDLRAIASEADVDAVLTGTLLRAGPEMRVSMQLVEAPSGTLLWSHAGQVPLDDLFRAEDGVAAAVVSALRLPLSSDEHGRLQRDVPANPEAYGLYLRANRLSDSSSSRWEAARELYEQAVDADPQYAPAWARLGRCLRRLGKFLGGEDAPALASRAEHAFRRAFQLNPDLPLAHNLYTYAEVETGRARDAMVRLLLRLQHRSSEPELFAGLVHACRYCGLIDASIAADRHAKRLDPGMRTSVAHTFFVNAEFDRAIEEDHDDPPFVSLHALLSTGRRDEAAAVCQRTLGSSMTHLLPELAAVRAVIDGRHGDGAAAMQAALSRRSFKDPEGFFYWALTLMLLGDRAGALDLLQRAVAGGLYCPSAFELNPVLDPLRGQPAFADLLERARAAHDEAATAFHAAGGRRLLGLA